MSAAQFSRGQLDTAFAALSVRLVEREVDATIMIFGQAAMMFAHDVRAAVTHVDASPNPRGLVLGAAREAGAPLGMPAHWINDQAAGTLPRFVETDVVELWRAPNMRVTTLSAEVLLAMTALTLPSLHGAADITVLAERAGITSSIDVEVLIAELYPNRTLNAKARVALDDLL